MVRSDLGDIPEGWRVGKLGDIAKNIKNGIRESEIKPEMLHIGLEHIPRRCIALDSWEQAVGVASNKFKFVEGNILFGKLRPYFHKVGIAPVEGICSTDILVVDSKDKTYFEIVLMLLSSDDFIRYVTLASEGTRMPRTSWEYMKDYPITVSNSPLTKKFNELLHPSIEKLKVNIFHIQTLTKTRDALLPKLMSGQLRVKE
jgi:type I restriction enzyme, S subunit